MQEYLGKPNIVTMASISKMTSLEQVFKKSDHVVLFVSVNGPSDGHWQTMYKNINDELIFFDSYGMQPCALIKNLAKAGHQTYGQNLNLLSLIAKSQYYPSKCAYNSVKYQSDNASSETCGRYVILNLLLLKIYNSNKQIYNSTEFGKVMTNLKKQYGLSYDGCVAEIISDVDILN